MASNIFLVSGLTAITLVTNKILRLDINGFVIRAYKVEQNVINNCINIWTAQQMVYPWTVSTTVTVASEYTIKSIDVWQKQVAVIIDIQKLL